MMFRKQYLLVIRNIKKRKLSTAVIITSIALGLSIATILFGFIQRETHTDFFHTKKQSIYRLLSNDLWVDNRKTLSFIRQDASEYIASNYPEIKSVCNVTDLSGDGLVAEHKTNTFEKTMVVAVDSTFFEMFDFPFLEGNKNNASEPYGIVMTKKLALKIYGRADVLGEEVILHYDTLRIQFTVTGVLDEIDENTHFKFDALVPFSTFNKHLRGSTTYLNLHPQSIPSDLENMISGDKQMPSLIGPGECQYFLQPLVEIYFDKGNVKQFTRARDPDFIRAIWVIVFLILLIAIVNFINLFIISLVDRRKEFGVKRIQGATLSDVRLGMVFEVILYLGISLIFSVIVTVLCLPLFNEIFESDLSIAYLSHSTILTYVGLLLVLLTVIVSYILSYYLNRIRPINLMNDRQRLSFDFNKMFFTLQFVISMILIFCGTVIIRQMDFIQTKPLGFDREILELRLPKEGKPTDLSTLKTKLEQYSSLRNMSLASGNPISGNTQILYTINERESYAPYFMEGDETLITTLGLNLKAGTSLTRASGKDKIVNEKFIEYFNISDPIGAPIPGGKGEKIVGVLYDFNVSSLKQEIPLYMIGFKSEPSRLLINYSGVELEGVKNIVQKAWKEIFPNSPFKYAFLGEELLSKHKDDFYLSRIVITFASFSILISCFGLFALAKSNCQKKVKEIAIRKSLGASVGNIISLLIFDFGKWIMLSFLIAAVLGYYCIQQWIQTFAYRADINWQVFAVTAATSGIISLLAVSIQTIQASKSNPIKGLRYE